MPRPIGILIVLTTSLCSLTACDLFSRQVIATVGEEPEDMAAAEGSGDMSTAMDMSPSPDQGSPPAADMGVDMHSPSDMSAPDMCAPAEEICDGVDNDCDEQLDEGCDLDGDGYCAQLPDGASPPEACSLGGGDCDDRDSERSPGAEQSCSARDEDCDGAIPAPRVITRATARSPDVDIASEAMASGDNGLGLVWTAEEELHRVARFATAGSNGMLVNSSRLLHAPSESGLGVDIAWDPQSKKFGVALTVNVNGTNEVRFLLLNEDGSAAAPPLLIDDMQVAARVRLRVARDPTAPSVFGIFYNTLPGGLERDTHFAAVTLQRSTQAPVLLGRQRLASNRNVATTSIASYLDAQDAPRFAVMWTPSGARFNSTPHWTDFDARLVTPPPTAQALSGLPDMNISGGWQLHSLRGEAWLSWYRDDGLSWTYHIAPVTAGGDANAPPTVGDSTALWSIDEPADRSPRPSAWLPRGGDTNHALMRIGDGVWRAQTNASMGSPTSPLALSLSWSNTPLATHLDATAFQNALLLLDGRGEAPPRLWGMSPNPTQIQPNLETEPLPFSPPATVSIRAPLTTFHDPTDDALFVLQPNAVNSDTLEAVRITPEGTLEPPIDFGVTPEHCSGVRHDPLSGQLSCASSRQDDSLSNPQHRVIWTVSDRALSSASAWRTRDFVVEDTDGMNPYEFIPERLLRTSDESADFMMLRKSTADLEYYPYIYRVTEDGELKSVRIERINDGRYELIDDLHLTREGELTMAVAFIYDDYYGDPQGLSVQFLNAELDLLHSWSFEDSGLGQELLFLGEVIFDDRVALFLQEDQTLYRYTFTRGMWGPPTRDIISSNALPGEAQLWRSSQDDEQVVLSYRGVSGFEATLMSSDMDHPPIALGAAPLSILGAGGYWVALISTGQVIQFDAGGVNHTAPLDETLLFPEVTFATHTGHDLRLLIEDPSMRLTYYRLGCVP